MDNLISSGGFLVCDNVVRYRRFRISCCFHEDVNSIKNHTETQLYVSKEFGVRSKRRKVFN